MRSILLVLVSITSSGCASFSTETKAEESAWQALNITDAIQTYRGPVQRPECFHEQGTYGILPGHPTTTQLAAWAVGWGSLHLGVTKLLSDHFDNPWPTRIWEMVSITNTGIIVSNNAKTLLHPVCAP